MIKVSVMYPKGDDTNFDMEYYKTKHMEIVDRTMKPAKWDIDQGVNGPYTAIGNLYFDSMDAMQAGMSEGGEAMGDVVNFTNIKSEVQVSEILDV